jgi:hypothetical protein
MRHAWWLVLCQLTACGGKAVLDRETPASGGHGTTTTSSTTTTTGGGGVGGAAPDLCQLCAAATPASSGGLANPKIDEASGLAASRVHRGVFYVINDSGGAATVYAIDASGADLASYVLFDAKNLDWEDMASGPCSEGDGGACLFVGDIGDNLGMRSSYTVYRVREPEVIEAGAHTVEADAFTFTYPDGSHNSEALVADSTTGGLYLITKVKEGPSGVYALPPLVSIGPLVAGRVGDLTVPTGIARVTAASANDHGVLVRTYTNLFLYSQGDSIGERLVGEGCPVAAAAEAQGETVAWLPDGTGYLTVSEGPGSALYQYACAP